ncbi:MAG TPA: PD-(D/E)XK nuclease family protein [Burkholderiales bacterium]|nr:PD-(D/E)XK nuclease family protein [Burkholderiales bacterium]
MHRELTQRLVEGATVVTPNRRLASDLKRRFDTSQVAAGKAAWPTADILPWDAWLERTYGELARLDAGQQLLSAAQELAVWHQAIVDSHFAHSLLDPASTARIAREAATIQRAWRLDARAWRGGLSEDNRAFLGWSRCVEERCAERGWLDHARLADAVAARMRLDPSSAPRDLVLYGFDELNPQQRGLAGACRAAGTLVEEWHPADPAGHTERRSYVTAEAELAGVARQTRCLLEADAKLRIGVIVPDLARLRPEVLRLFDDVLEPARVLPGERRRPRPYNLSLGVPLSGYPLVHSALSVLRLAGGELPFTGAAALVRSPFLVAAEREFTERARIEVRLRQRGLLTVTIEALLAQLRPDRRDVPALCPVLLTRLETWQDSARRARSRRQPPSDWSSSFLSLLSGLGWPGERTLDSEEYQTYERWRELVRDLSALDPVLGPLGYDDALAWLTRLSADALFQPESEATPIQVLGVLEAAGLEFDHLFVVGLDDERWPAAPRPHPLLPAALQRAHAVAHSSAQWELEFARRITALWRSSAPRVTLTHAMRDQDRALRPSPLIAEVPLAASEAAVAEPGGYAESIRVRSRLERLMDARAPALPAGYRAVGGVAVFENQAACPFRALAIHRLGARGLEQPAPGLSARERGTLVHRALASLWGELQSQRRLLDASDGELRTIVERAVDTAVERLRRERGDAMSDAFAALERERVAGLLGRLLEIEKLRAPFSVLARELPRTLELGGLSVETRVDRIDQLEGGGRVVLDYKTGRASISGWGDERLDQPQIPLYAVTEPGELAAASLVAVNAQEVAFRGVAREEGLVPGVHTPAQSRTFGALATWKGMLDRWRIALDALARGFLAGEAAVAPRSYPRTCEWCDLGTLCRVKELFDRVSVSADEAPDD